MLFASLGIPRHAHRIGPRWRAWLRGSLLALLSAISAPVLAVDLGITDLSDTGSDPTPAGGVVTYSVTVENASADTAAGTFVLFDLPPGTTAVSLPPFCTANATVPTRIECDMGALDGILIGGQPVTFQIQVDTGGLQPGLVEIDAAVGQAPLPDPTVPLDQLPPTDPFFAADTNPTNNTASQSTTLIDSADLSLDKSATPNPVVAGGIVTFTIAVTNNGPSPSTNFSVQDSLPAGLVYIDGSASGTGWTFSGPNGTFAGTLPAGQTATYTFQAEATASSGNLVNSAVVTPTTPDPDTSNNSDSVDVGITAGADLAIGKSVTPAPAVAGETVTFTIVVENRGPNDATGVFWVDNMPPGFTITGGSQPAGWTCVTGPLNQNRRCDYTAGALPAGSSTTFTIDATVPTTGPGSSGDVTNTATIDSDTPDPEPSNDSGSATFTVLTPGADLALTKDKQPPLVNVWDGTEPDLDSQMTSTITVTNQGPDSATGQVQVTDVLAPGEQFLGASPTPPWTCTVAPPVYIGPGTPQTVTCTLDASALPLAPGQSAPPLTITTRAREPGTLTNTACTGGSGGTLEPITGGGVNVDGNPGNDCSGDGSGSTVQSADLSITKQTNGAGEADNTLPVTYTSFTYTLTITNAGPDGTPGVVVNDPIPGFIPGVTTASAVAPAGWTCTIDANGSLVCRSDATVLAGGASVTIPITVNGPMLDSAVRPAGTCGGAAMPAGSWCNTAGVGVDPAVPGAIGEIDDSNNSAGDYVRIPRVANVQTTAKTITTGAQGQVGVPSTHRIDYHNQGPSTASAVVFRDVIALPPNDSGFVLNTAVRDGGGTTTCTAVPGANVTAVAAPGGTRYHTEGAGAGLLTITCTPLDMASGQSNSLTITLTPIFNLTSNPARAFPDTGDFFFDFNGDGTPDPSNGADGFGNYQFNTDPTNADDQKTAALTFATGEVDLITNKVDVGFTGGVDPMGYDPNDTSQNFVSYQITVINNGGPSAATGVRITDTISPQAGATVRYAGASATAGGPFDPNRCAITAGSNPVTGPATMTLECIMPGAGFPGSDQLGVINVNAQSAIYLSFEYLTPPSATGDTLNDSATASGNETDTQPGNNSEDENTSIRTRVDMAVSKTTVTQAPDANPTVALPPTVDPVTVREPFFYVIEAVNNGPGSSLSLDRSGTNPLNGPGTRIVDTLPAGVIVTGTITWQKVGPSVGVGDVPNGTGTCSLAGSTVTCDLGDVTFAPGNGGRVRIIVPARWDTVPAGGTSSNTATVSTQQVDNTNGNDTATVPLGVIASTITGTVFEDRDRAGANGGVPQDASAEPRVPGVTLALAGTDVYGNAISLTTTTDGSGNFTFGELSPSDASGYAITQTQPTGYVNGPVDPPATGGNAPSLGGTYARGGANGNSSFATIPVGRQDAGIRYNFPELINASLSGFVYSDANSDNTRTVGTDPPIVGATVELLNAITSAVLQTATTDANGAYTFVNLDPNVVYTLREPLPAGTFNNAPLAVNPGLVSGAPCTSGCTRGTGVAGDPLTTDRISDIDLAVGNGQGTDFNFGENPTDVAISGRVWLDTNDNGVIDSGETGIAGIAMRLTGINNNGIPVLQDVNTDADGNYVFTGLVPGTYTVTETVQPTGTFNGTTVVGTVGGTATDRATTPSSISGIVTTAGVPGTGYNFGEIQPASIAGSVFYDFNNDGLINGGEVGIASVTVTLTGTTDTGAAVNTDATTDANGAFAFADQRPGTYTLTEPTQPPGTTNGITTPGTINGAPSGTATPVTTTPSAISNIALGAGNASITNLFGEIADGEIAGRVWLDNNNNGAIDTGENGIGGVQIDLAGVVSGGGAVARSVTTNPDGTWAFTSLPPGTYAVVEPAQPTGTLSGATVAGTGGGTATDPATVPSRVSGIALGVSQQVDGYLFGEIPPGTITGRVYIDGNRNGVQDGVEVGIANVAVVLSGIDDLAQNVSLPLTTGPLGGFQFENLRPGVYALTEPDQPPATSDGITDPGNILGVRSGSPTATGTVPSRISGIVLPSGQAHIDNLFGEFPTGSLAGRVWLDVDNDGVIDTGETGIADVTVELSGQTLTGVPFNLTDTTDADGRYEFTGLPAGTYTVTEPNQPAGTVNGITVPGSSGGTATAPNTVPSQISGIVMTLNENATDYNFGEAPGASIAGKVYIDENLNGAYDDGEAGIPNVIVVLNGNDDLGQAVNAPMSALFNALAMRLVVNGTTATDANGDYRFDTLRPGTYTVTEPDQPPLTTDGVTTPGTVNGVPDGVATPRGTLPSAISEITLTPGAAAIGANFGEIADSPDLKVSKSAAPAQFTVNNIAKYSIRVRNTGPKTTAGDYVVEDRLPPGLTLAATPTGNGWACTGAVGESRLSCTSSVPIARDETRADAILVQARVDASALANSPVNNAVLVQGGGEDEAHVPSPAERAAFEGDVTGLPVCDPAITHNACRVATPIQLASAVSGTVWFDAGSDDTHLDGGDVRLDGWHVEFVDAATGNLVAEVLTAADGTYRIPDLIPGVRHYLRFRHPTSGVLWGFPVTGETAAGPPAPCDADAAIAGGTASTCRVTDQSITQLEVVLQSGAELPQQSLPVDPGGVVYDVVTRDPVPGSVVTLAPSGTCASFDPATSILNGGAGGYSIEGNAISMTVGANGFYQFLFAPTAPPRCDYTLRVTPPGGFAFPSTVIPTQPGTLNPPGAVGTTFDVQPQPAAPTAPVGAGTAYYLALSSGSATASIVHNHIPLDPAVAPGLVITKTGDRQVVELGDTLLYTITIHQTAGEALDDVNVIDNLPPGFTYIDGTARADGRGIADPLGKPGPRLVFDVGPIRPGQQIQLSYRVRIGIGSMQGDGINRAQAFGCSIEGGCVDPGTLQPLPGTVPSNRAQYRVRVTGGVFTDEGCVLGKIFVDGNNNHIQDHEELGIPGVRFYFEDGTWMVSDSEGKYSYCGLPPKSHTLKVDASTLPLGSRLTTSSNRNLGDATSLFIDLKNGELHRADFIEGSGSNEVLEQVKARRTQGETSAPQTEVQGAPLSFQTQPLGAPSGATMSARQDPTIVAPRGTQRPPGVGVGGGIDNVVPAATGATTAPATTDAAPSSDIAPAPADTTAPAVPDHRFEPALGAPTALYPQTPSTTDEPPHALDVQSGNVDYSVNTDVDVVRVDVDRDGVPADGQSPVHVVVQLLGQDERPLAGDRFATIEYSGGRVQLPGGRTDELGPGKLDADRVTPGIQLPVKDGRAEFDLLAPDVPQDVLLRITAGGVSAENTVSFLPEMREMLATGLIEGVVNFRNGGSLDPVRRDDGFDRDIRRWEREFNNGKANGAARAAFFVKGTIKGEYLLTAAYDSDKEVRGRLLRDIQPAEFYPVYGDSSLRGFDARSAERLYVRVDKNRSYLLYGDFQTGDSLASQTGVATSGRIVMRSLGNYNRTATGFGWHFEGKRVRGNVFAMEDSLRQVIDEFPSQGSGPYGLSNNAVLEGSERVEVITRDRNQPSRIVSVRPLGRLVDYSFEPFSGRILLNQFLPAFDSELNPISLRITYELDQGTEKFWVYGIDAQFRLSRSIEAGASYVNDENPFAPFRMGSANLGFRFGKNTWLVVEAARTESEVNTNSINQYATPGLQNLSGEVEGDAYRLEFGHDGKNFDATLFAGRSDPAFNNPSSPLYGGRGEYDLELTWTINERFELYVEALRSEDRNPDGGDRNAGGAGVRIGASKRLTLDFGVRAIRETIGAYSPWSISPPFGSTGGLSGGFATGSAGGALGYGQQPLDPLTGLPVIRSDGTVPTSDLPVGTELESDTVHVGAGYKINDKFVVGGEYEQDFNGEDRNRVALGVDYRLMERNRLYGRYERQTGLTSAFGITTADREADAIVFGIDSTYLKDTQVFSEYRLRDAISGRDVQMASGIRNDWDIKEGLRLSTAAEHVKIYDGDTGDTTALAFGLDYSANPLWRGAMRVEYRVSGDVDGTVTDEEFNTTLFQLLWARKLSRDWTLLARNYLLATDYQARGDVLQDRFQLGVAYRDTDRNRVNALARYEYKLEEDNSGIGIAGLPEQNIGSDIRTRAHIVSAHADWHPSRPWWLTGRVAAKWQEDRFVYNDGGRVDDRFRGVLVSGRVVYDITENWDVGVLASTFQGDYDANQYAYGVEIGRLLRQNLWLSVGYNFVGFEGDPDLTGYEYTDEGAFIRLRFKFDENLFLRDDDRYRRPAQK
ncbi:SdrD B-like domain-containing protein [Lysobacter auxotrophicus]|uniref:SpaA isopeptide-forming pilin-related protein n=1 Tax=Lysobacter auxotrophicus TaxID=2992573 RepID=A0ABN6UK31_9GAMM|nr:SdrD B-like domain-containing protein [Lysobacter auxotrophicus]BDU16637.1 SpaA isopeptide-forming pilin-related protein [Lysobacter auxotrophicus]